MSQKNQSGHKGGNKGQHDTGAQQSGQQDQGGGTGGKHAQQGDHKDTSPSSAAHRGGGHGHKQPDAGLGAQSKKGN